MAKVPFDIAATRRKLFGREIPGFGDVPIGGTTSPAEPSIPNFPSEDMGKPLYWDLSQNKAVTDPFSILGAGFAPDRYTDRFIPIYWDPRSGGATEVKTPVVYRVGMALGVTEVPPELLARAETWSQGQMEKERFVRQSQDQQLRNQRWVRERQVEQVVESSKVDNNLARLDEIKQELRDLDEITRRGVFGTSMGSFDPATERRREVLREEAKGLKDEISQASVVMQFKDIQGKDRNLSLIPPEQRLTGLNLAGHHILNALERPYVAAKSAISQEAAGGHLFWPWLSDMANAVGQIAGIQISAVVEGIAAIKETKIRRNAMVRDIFGPAGEFAVTGRAKIGDIEIKLPKIITNVIVGPAQGVLGGLFGFVAYAEVLGEMMDDNFENTYHAMNRAVVSTRDFYASLISGEPPMGGYFGQTDEQVEAQLRYVQSLEDQTWIHELAEKNLLIEVERRSKDNVLRTESESIFERTFLSLDEADFGELDMTDVEYNRVYATAQLGLAAALELHMARSDIPHPWFQYSQRWMKDGETRLLKTKNAIVSFMLTAHRMPLPWEFEEISERFADPASELVGGLVFDPINLIPGVVFEKAFDVGKMILGFGKSAGKLGLKAVPHGLDIALGGKSANWGVSQNLFVGRAKLMSDWFGQLTIRSTRNQMKFWTTETINALSRRSRTIEELLANIEFAADLIPGLATDIGRSLKQSNNIRKIIKGLGYDDIEEGVKALKNHVQIGVLTATKHREGLIKNTPRLLREVALNYGVEAAAVTDDMIQTAARAWALNPANLGSFVGDAIGSTYIGGHKLFEGSILLDEGFTAWVIKNTRLNEGQVFKLWGDVGISRNTIDSTMKFWNGAMSLWKAAILTLRPGFSIINYLDSTLRAASKGADLASSMDEIADMIRLGKMPQEILDRYAGADLPGIGNIADLILSGNAPNGVPGIFAAVFQSTEGNVLNRFGEAARALNTVFEFTLSAQLYASLYRQDFAIASRLMAARRADIAADLLDDVADVFDQVATQSAGSAKAADDVLKQILGGKGAWVVPRGFVDELADIIGPAESEIFWGKVADDVNMILRKNGPWDELHGATRAKIRREINNVIENRRSALIAQRDEIIEELATMREAGSASVLEGKGPAEMEIEELLGRAAGEAPTPAVGIPEELKGVAQSPTDAARFGDQLPEGTRIRVESRPDGAGVAQVQDVGGAWVYGGEPNEHGFMRIIRADRTQGFVSPDDLPVGIHRGRTLEDAKTVVGDAPTPAAAVDDVSVTSRVVREVEEEVGEKVDRFGLDADMRVQQEIEAALKAEGKPADLKLIRQRFGQKLNESRARFNKRMAGLRQRVLALKEESLEFLEEGVTVSKRGLTRDQITVESALAVEQLVYMEGVDDALSQLYSGTFREWMMEWYPGPKMKHMPIELQQGLWEKYDSMRGHIFDKSADFFDETADAVLGVERVPGAVVEPPTGKVPDALPSRDEILRGWGFEIDYGEFGEMTSFTFLHDMNPQDFSPMLGDLRKQMGWHPSYNMTFQEYMEAPFIRPDIMYEGDALRQKPIGDVIHPDLLAWWDDLLERDDGGMIGNLGRIYKNTPVSREAGDPDYVVRVLNERYPDGIMDYGEGRVVQIKPIGPKDAAEVSGVPLVSEGYWRPGKIHVIETAQRDKGLGTQALDDLKRIADEYNAPMQVFPRSAGDVDIARAAGAGREAGMTTQEIQQWYLNNGFERVEGVTGLVYHPADRSGKTVLDNFDTLRSHIWGQHKQALTDGKPLLAELYKFRHRQLIDNYNLAWRTAAPGTVPLSPVIGPANDLPMGMRNFLKMGNNVEGRAAVMDDMLVRLQSHVDDSIKNQEWQIAFDASERQNLVTAVGEMGRLQDDAIDKMNYGGDFLGHEFEGLVPQINETMIDYAKTTNPEQMLKKIWPFFHFPQKSIPFWIQTMATNPELPAFYAKYIQSSKIHAYNRGATNSRGEQLPRLFGYLPMPGSDDQWWNPLAPFSFRFVFPRPVPRYDQASAEMPLLTQIVDFVYEYGQGFGFTPSPWFSLAMRTSGHLDNNRHPQWALIPQPGLVPPFATRHIAQELRKWAYPNAPWLWTPQVPWKDSLIEVKVLEQAMEELMDPNLTEAQRERLLIEIENTIATKDRVTGDGAYEYSAGASRWLDARDKVETMQHYSRFMGYFTSIYPKEFTALEAEVHANYDRINTLKYALNNEAGAVVLNLEPDINRRWPDYLEKRYNTPEGWLSDLYGARRFTIVEGEQLRGDDREKYIATNILEAQQTRARYDAYKQVSQRLQDRLDNVDAIGVPWDELQPLFQEFFEAGAKIEAAPEFGVARVEWIVGWKPKRLVWQDIINLYWSTVEKTRPVFREESEEYGDFLPRLEEWKLSFGAMSILAAKAFWDEFNAIEWIHPEINGLPDLVERLLGESTPDGYRRWKLSKDTALGALARAWTENYWSEHGARTADQEGLDWEIAQREFYADIAELNGGQPPIRGAPVGPSPDVLFGWVNTDREVAGVEPFTEGELLEALGEKEILNADERMQRKRGAEIGPELAEFEEQMWQIYSMIPPGNSDEFTDEYVRLDGPYGDEFLGIWRASGSADSFRDEEQFKEAVEIARQVTRNLGFLPPTDIELVERDEARELNDDFRAMVEQMLGDDFDREQNVYWRMSSSERRAYRKENPDFADSLDIYFDLRDAYAVQFPVWGKYYNPDALTEEGKKGAGGGGGGGTRSAAGGGRTPSVSIPPSLRPGLRGAPTGEALLGRELGKGGVTGRFTWPRWLLEKIGQAAIDELEKEAEAGTPFGDLDDALKSLLKNLDTNDDKKDVVEEVKKVYNRGGGGPVLKL